MNWKRSIRHLLMPPWRVRQLFPKSVMRAIEDTIRKGETTHSGQVCFAVEAALDTRRLLRGVSAHERTIEVFSRLRVWDTENNNGVLIYLLLAEHNVEILADRGIHAKVSKQAWEKICREMETHFRSGHFEEGALTGIQRVTELLARHYPGSGPNTLSDRPVVL
ncbi:MAG: TPM domain-containing protein [Gammaproteobacteria bacterium]|nr:TPM domain-containing protein [Gammaproteobacteria bacterium]